ncbi:class II glutamine amidotransferase [Legionella sp. km772]|uniref:class II glutamine amidotransferase n=1 Tax=Legionella sp. km772 TaxID=2498111 RepID=UPI000F8DC8BF|nr:class II glutamine amidotransferase [Legionella sp. km772]RUR11302.1 class II glutamine amidotransferase [Legionella sp. km772]
MCRFVAYIGKNILLSDILVKPEHSLIKQSLLSRESRTVTNGDGFGLGWYTTFSKSPALFTSLFPAWNDRNLAYLAKKTKAPLFFGHVRAASSGGISQFNCHPFLYKNWMFMHNGWLPSFEKIKREFLNLLDDDLYKWVKGSTDSELIFALFLQLAKKHQHHKLFDIVAVLEETFSLIISIIKNHQNKAVAHLNICISDGKRLVASRYCNSKYVKPETMYVHLGQQSLEGKTEAQSVIVASEKLSKSRKDWKLIPSNNCIVIEPNLAIAIQPLNINLN